MRIYNIDLEDYFKCLTSKKFFFESVHITMQNLIDRFELSNKKILSIGTSYGFEEFWFHQNGCILTFVDVDLKRNMEKFLKKIKPVLNANVPLCYIIGDIRMIMYQFNNKYNVIYTSGIQGDVLYSKIGLSDWVFKCINVYLPEDEGIFICQSYHQGLNMALPEAVTLIQKQCEREGVFLVSIYCFYPFDRRVNLIIIFKGLEERFKEYIIKIKQNKEISDFHGRSTMEHSIRKVYEYENEKIKHE